MPRIPRTKSATGIYHVMVRGIDKRNIFLDDQDKTVFLEKLQKAKERSQFKLHGYCLMNNHVHLLIQEDEDLGNTVKKITVGYVQWHNNRHLRTGHLFQNRYKSQNVESEPYLLTVLRYIHQNPVKANITSSPENYNWSSYNECIKSYKGEQSFLDTGIIREYFKSASDFEEYMNVNTDEQFLDYVESKKYTDDSLRDLIKRDFGIDTLENYPTKERNEIIKNIYSNEGVSIRQLSRVLNLGRSTIERAIK